MLDDVIKSCANSADPDGMTQNEALLIKIEIIFDRNKVIFRNVNS